MNTHQQETAERCLRAAHEDTLTFPSIVKTLMDAGFEGYQIDFRRGTARYYLPSGGSTELTAHDLAGSVAEGFDATTVQRAIREAQVNAPGYTYVGFCEKVRGAGCAGYIVSFLGKRVIYFGRTAETHVEHFPQ